MEVEGQEHLDQDGLQGGLEDDGLHTVLWLEDDERHFDEVAVDEVWRAGSAHRLPVCGRREVCCVAAGQGYDRGAWVGEGEAGYD